MSPSLRHRQEWQLFTALHRAAPVLSTVWWLLLLLRGVLPAVFAIGTGAVVGAVETGGSLAGPLTFVGVVVRRCCRSCRRSTRPSARTSAAARRRGSTTA